MTDEEFIVWSAGFYDGEGCILVTSNPARTRFTLLSSVAQQDPQPLRMLKKRFGGGVNTDIGASIGYKRKNGTALIWRWKVSGAKAYDFFLAIEPYSITKQSQLQLALTWPTPHVSYRGSSVPAEINQRREQIMYELRDIRKANKIMLEEPDAQ